MTTATNMKNRYVGMSPYKNDMIMILFGKLDQKINKVCKSLGLELHLTEAG